MNAANLALARLKKEECTWYDYYTGTISDLIAAGLLLPSQVPGTNDNPKVQATFGPDGSLMGRMGRHSCGYALRVTLRGRARAQVCIPVEEAETQRRRNVNAEQAQRECLADRAKALIDRIPRTHDAYRESTRGFAQIVLHSVIHNTAATKEHGYRYGDDERERLQELCGEILSILSEGTTLFDASIQSAAMVAQQSIIAKADGGFRKMLRLVVPAEGSHHA